jgi:hypothetical protein
VIPAGLGFAAGVTVTLVILRARRALVEAIPPILRTTTLMTFERDAR